MVLEYKLLTWNVRGIATPTKRHRVYTYLRRRHIQIACIQETHLTKTELVKLNKRWRGQIFGTHYSAFARGVLIWVAPGIPFVKTKVTIDSEGRYVILTGELDGRPLNIAALYCPNANQRAFLGELSPALFTDPMARDCGQETSIAHTPSLWTVQLLPCRAHSLYEYLEISEPGQILGVYMTLGD